jgi:malto-oligosyltrehalose trehalohydrolase
VAPSSHRSVTPDTPPGGQKTRAHHMPFGAELWEDGAVRFRLWAPSHWEIQLELDDKPELLTMRPIGDGWHELTTDRARPGTRYQFVLPGDRRVPDPASRYQAKDVHGPSEVVDPTGYLWTDADWRGRPWEEAVVYELHIGAFTPAGTFQAATEKLEHLVALGATTIEIMPVGDFPGARNWGYDGVLPYAPDAVYGRPEDLKALVNAAHRRGLMVLLDVVYNHFGPEGAYIHTIAPEMFTDRHTTPWGMGINMDGPGARPVREFFIHNALYWIEEFHFDGLRLDAVHAIRDDSSPHILTELAERVRTAAPDRHIHLLLENEENAAHRLERREGGPEGLNEGDIGPRWYTAQWNDDVHHVLHVAATGEAQGYYGDYAGDTEKLGRALAEGFAFQGEMMAYRGHNRGEPSAALPPASFVAFIQNHDHIGNRPFSDRLTSLVAPEAVHGRRMGGGSAVSLLLRLRPRTRERRASRQAPGVRAFPRLPRSCDDKAHPRSDRRGNLCCCQTRVGRCTAGAACRLARLVLPRACHAERSNCAVSPAHSLGRRLPRDWRQGGRRAVVCRRGRCGTDAGSEPGRGSEGRLPAAHGPRAVARGRVGPLPRSLRSLGCAVVGV